MDKETFEKLIQDFDNMCDKYNECWDCPYGSNYCQMLFAYDDGYEKGYAQAKRDMDTRTDIQRFRVSGHP